MLAILSDPTTRLVYEISIGLHCEPLKGSRREEEPMQFLRRARYLLVSLAALAAVALAGAANWPKH